MKRYIIPTLALAIGITVINTHDVSAADLTSAQIIAKSDTAITNRINDLNKLSTKVSKFKHLTTEQRNSINSSIQSSINAMSTLKTKIDTDTDMATLKADAASITKDYRIYAVVMPSEATLAATDNAIANIETAKATLAALQPKITPAVQASYDTAVAKLADATTQSQTLIDAITGLQPDKGDKTVQASNKAKVAAAATARKAMLADIAAAKKAIAAIKAGLKK